MDKLTPTSASGGGAKSAAVEHPEHAAHQDRAERQSRRAAEKWEKKRDKSVAHSVCFGVLMLRRWAVLLLLGCFYFPPLAFMTTHRRCRCTMSF